MNTKNIPCLRLLYLQCKSFINRFLRDVNPLLESQKILKNNELSHTSYRQCLKLMETIPPRSPVCIGFTNWMEKQIMIAENIGLENTGLPISSEPPFIEDRRLIRN